MQTIDFNLNEYILVKLTDLGYQILVDKYNYRREWVQGEGNYEKIEISYFKDRADENGYTKYQAWEFMAEFGQTLNGSHPALYFETTIKIYVPE